MKFLSSQSVSRNGIHEERDQTFGNFFENWITKQKKDLEELVSASKKYDGDEGLFSSLIDRVFQHYEQYYAEKSRWAKQDVLKMLNPCWRSNLEDAFLWIGGWRPTMAFHLLYSKCGIQLEAKLSQFFGGLSSRDLGDLSATQLREMDELQRKTIKKEKEISEKHGEQQETVADASMVELSNMVTEMIRSGEEERRREVVEDQVEPTLRTKEEGLVEILQMADDLRLRTLRDIKKILNPLQLLHFLIAAAELHLRIHEWGLMKDARNATKS